MYKLLKPIQSGFQALLKEFEDHISTTGLGKVKSLHNENVGIVCFHFRYDCYAAYCLYLLLTLRNCS